MKTRAYKAKGHYGEADVALNYEKVRFTSWHGKLAHSMERQALEYVIDRYFEAGGTVLDIPCGTGRLLSPYIQRKFKVTGVDISELMLSIAIERYKDNPLFSFLRCDVENLPFCDNSFDYLVSFRLMPHLPPNLHGDVLAEMIRVTRHSLVVNVYLDVKSPVMIFNRIFRKTSCPPHPVLPLDFKQELRKMPVDLCEIRKLSWYERNSVLVILRKR